MLRVLGQVALTYIVAEGPEGLYVIDQHAAHERVMYERLTAARGSAAGQALLVPESVALAPREMAVIEENLATFLALGFAVEPFGGDAVLLRAIPEGIPAADASGLLRAIIDSSAEGRATGDAFEERLIRAVCKQATVKAGRVLNMEEMRSLVHSLEACAAPGTCPHGRPTMVMLDGGRLASEFRRG